MVELEFLGISDGRLVFTDPDGERYMLTPNPEISNAIRTATQPVPISTSTTLGVKDIQARLRAGDSVEVIAAAAGMDPAAIRAFSSPIMAERQYMATRAVESTIGKDGPTLGDIVVDRLAARGIDPSTIEWDATRSLSQPWHIHLTFVQDAQIKEAHWSFESEHVIAIDQEASWLSETVTPSGSSSMRTLTPLATPEQIETIDPPSAGTEVLLDALKRARGRRSATRFEDEDDELAEYEAAIRGDVDIESPSVNTQSTSRLGGLFGLRSVTSETYSESKTTTSEAVPEKILTVPQLADMGVPEVQTRTRPALTVSDIVKEQTSPPAPLNYIQDMPTVQTEQQLSPRVENASTENLCGTDKAVTCLDNGLSDSESPDKTTMAEECTTYAADGLTPALPGLGSAGAIPPAPTSAEQIVGKKRTDPKRRSVPSWDEIVFGSRPR